MRGFDARGCTSFPQKEPRASENHAREPALPYAGPASVSSAHPLTRRAWRKAPEKGNDSGERCRLCPGLAPRGRPRPPQAPRVSPFFPLPAPPPAASDPACAHLCRLLLLSALFYCWAVLVNFSFRISCFSAPFHNLSPFIDILCMMSLGETTLSRFYLIH